MPAHRHPMTAGSGFAPANDISQMLMGLEELSIAIVPQPSRANRPTDSAVLHVSKSEKYRLCQKHHHEGDEHRRRRGGCDFKDRLACRRDAHVVEERKGEDVQERSRACHDGRGGNNAQVACADDVFARERQRCSIALPTVLVIVASQRVHDYDGRHGADCTGAGAHAGVTIRRVGKVSTTNMNRPTRRCSGETSA